MQTRRLGRTGHHSSVAILGGAAFAASTWTDDDPIARGVGFALSTPGVTGFCTVGDLTLLPRVLDAADHFMPWSEAERRAMVNSMDDEPIIFPLADHFRRDA